MKKQAIVVSIVATLALAFAIVGCVPAGNTAKSDSNATKHENPKFIGAEDVDNSYDSFLTPTTASSNCVLRSTRRQATPKNTAIPTRTPISIARPRHATTATMTMPK